jgi:putative oxidoreductase
MANAHGPHWDLGFLRNWSAQIALVGRSGLAFVFIVDGWQAIANFANVGDYMQANGVSARLLPLVIATELGGGLMVVTGFAARGGNRAGRVLPADRAIFSPRQRRCRTGDQFSEEYCDGGGFLMLAAFGPGGWSIDAWRTK